MKNTNNTKRSRTVKAIAAAVAAVATMATVLFASADANKINPTAAQTHLDATSKHPGESGFGYVAEFGYMTYGYFCGNPFR